MCVAFARRFFGAVGYRASPKVTAFFVGFNPFQIWSFVLLALGLRTIAGFAPAGSYIVAAAVVLAGLLFPVLVAR